MSITVMLLLTNTWRRTRVQAPFLLSGCIWTYYICKSVSVEMLSLFKDPIIRSGKENVCFVLKKRESKINKLSFVHLGMAWGVKTQIATHFITYAIVSIQCMSPFPQRFVILCKLVSSKLELTLLRTSMFHFPRIHIMESNIHVVW